LEGTFFRRKILNRYLCCFLGFFLGDGDLKVCFWFDVYDFIRKSYFGCKYYKVIVCPKIDGIDFI